MSLETYTFHIFSLLQGIRSGILFYMNFLLYIIFIWTIFEAIETVQCSSNYINLVSLSITVLALGKQSNNNTYFTNNPKYINLIKFSMQTASHSQEVLKNQWNVEDIRCVFDGMSILNDCISSGIE